MRQFSKRDVSRAPHWYRFTGAHWFGLAATVSAVFWFCCVPIASGQQGKPSVYDVEGTYLYQFAKFVQWPGANGATDQTAPFVICVLGHDPFGPILDNTIKGENVDGAAIAAKRIASSDEASGCRILFIAASEENRLAKTLMPLSKLPILTVSDIPDFADHGGMIGLLLKDNRVRFEVNLMNAQTAGLTLSSQLLKVAISVKGQPGSQK